MSPEDWNLVIKLYNRALLEDLKGISIFKSFKKSICVKIIVFFHIFEASPQLNYMSKYPSLSLDYQFIILSPE